MNKKKCSLSNHQLRQRILSSQKTADIHYKSIIPFPKIKSTLKEQILSPLRVLKRTSSPEGKSKVFPDQSHHWNKPTGSLRTYLQGQCSFLCESFVFWRPNHSHYSAVTLHVSSGLMNCCYASESGNFLWSISSGPWLSLSMAANAP